MTEQELAGPKNETEPTEGQNIYIFLGPSILTNSSFWEILLLGLSKEFRMLKTRFPISLRVSFADERVVLQEFGSSSPG